jgi:hypothetical protein
VNASAARTAVRTAPGTARAIGIVLIVAVAAAGGLAAGNVIQELISDRSQTAEASFSLDAIADLQALRADGTAAAPTYVDYAVRHIVAPVDYPDFGVRHLASAATLTDTFRLTGPSDVDSPAVAPMSDTFRLTGPSKVEPN